MVDAKMSKGGPDGTRLSWISSLKTQHCQKQVAFPVTRLKEPTFNITMKSKFYRKPSGLIMYVINDYQFANNRFYFSTGETCEEKDWDPKKGETKKPSALNVRLFHLKKIASEYMLLNKQNLTTEGLKSALKGTAPKEVVVPKSRTIIEHYADYLKTKKGNVEPSSYISYKRSYDVFSNFLDTKRMSALFPVEFNEKVLNQYVNYLRKEAPHDRRSKVVNKGYDINTIAKRLKNLRNFFQYIERMGIKVGVELDEIAYKEVAGIKLRWTEEELEKLEKMELSGRIAEARDLTLLQCGTGLRISDLFRVGENIFNDKIHLETKKIKGRHVVVPIIPMVRRVLEKYNYKPPVMSEPTYRGHIKELYRRINPDAQIQVRRNGVFETVPIWKEISSHDNVRTFVTLCAQKGMHVKDIAQITGKTIKILLNNYLVEDQKVAESSMLRAWGN